MRFPGPCCLAPARRLTNGDTSPIGDASTTRLRRVPLAPRMLPRGADQPTGPLSQRAGQAAGTHPAQVQRTQLPGPELPLRPLGHGVPGCGRGCPPSATPSWPLAFGRGALAIRPDEASFPGGARPFPRRRPLCAARALPVAASPAIAVGEALAYSMQAKSIQRSRFVQDRHERQDRPSLRP